MLCNKEMFMRKILKRVISGALIASMMLSFSACGKENDNKETTTVNVEDMTPEEFYGVDSWAAVENEVSTEDHYRNYYEVFVYSFADSDGDGIGDIQGLISKLDYIQDLGFNGIWLMPIMPSTTYHKYDVTDYRNIDAEYGTLDDFSDLIDECHKRNINVIIDLIFNHTSSKHEWFVTAKEYYKSLEAGAEPDFEECPYANYYNFKKTEDLVNASAYTKIQGSEYSYESMFWSEMPDLNLNNEAVRKEIEDIVDFWIDLGVDGFRLDAAKEYTSANAEANIEVLNWFSNYVKGVKEDAYIVAEVWDTYARIKQYYSSGIESIFDYAYGDSSGLLFTCVNQGNGKKLATNIQKTEAGYLEENPNMVNAPFGSNHDTGRIAGFTSKIEEKIKITAAINQIMSGCSFVYYGEEIGMSGSGKDENKRAPMYWTISTDGIMTDGPSAMDSGITHNFGTVEEQMENKNSIYWYYKKMLHIRNTYEEIPKGRTTALENLDDDGICGLLKKYNDESMYILCNVTNEEITVTLSKSEYSYEKMVEFLVTNIEQEIKIDGDKITLPPYSIAFLK